MTAKASAARPLPPKREIADWLARLEQNPREEAMLARLDAAANDPGGLVVAVTGAPGAGKSTMLGHLALLWRAKGLSVAILAVDPSSPKSGGALLGDRTRFRLDPADQKLFVRSFAARDRLGGLSDLALRACTGLRASFDLVLLETVGVGQSEADAALIADQLLLCVPPAGGDSLQFMKAGLMELPDMVVVTKADLGGVANQAAADMRAALSLIHPKSSGTLPPELFTVSADKTETLSALAEAVLQRDQVGQTSGQKQARRDGMAASWVRDQVKQRHGSAGWSAVQSEGASSLAGPFATAEALCAKLDEALRPLTRPGG